MQYIILLTSYAFFIELAGEAKLSCNAVILSETAVVNFYVMKIAIGWLLKINYNLFLWFFIWMYSGILSVS